MDATTREDDMNWLIRKTYTEEGTVGAFLVGYFEPGGTWVTHQRYLLISDAESAVNYLNGGTGE
jgi:hypothetical protein